jgi:hypothetical protein
LLCANTLYCVDVVLKLFAEFVFLEKIKIYIFIYKI